MLLAMENQKAAEDSHNRETDDITDDWMRCLVLFFSSGFYGLQLCHVHKKKTKKLDQYPAILTPVGQ